MMQLRLQMPPTAARVCELICICGDTERVWTSRELVAAGACAESSAAAALYAVTQSGWVRCVSPGRAAQPGRAGVAARYAAAMRVMPIQSPSDSGAPSTAEPPGDFGAPSAEEAPGDSRAPSAEEAPGDPGGAARLFVC
jgi:hypothetical protein